MIWRVETTQKSKGVFADLENHAPFTAGGRTSVFPGTVIGDQCGFNTSHDELSQWATVRGGPLEVSGGRSRSSLLARDVSETMRLAWTARTTLGVKNGVHVFQT